MEKIIRRNYSYSIYRSVFTQKRAKTGLADSAVSTCVEMLVNRESQNSDSRAANSEKNKENFQGFNLNIDKLINKIGTKQARIYFQTIRREQHGKVINTGWTHCALEAD